MAAEREWFDACQAVADDYEHATLEDLAIRAGLLSKCEECGWVSTGQAGCENSQAHV